MRPIAYTWDNAMVEGRHRLALLEQALDPSNGHQDQNVMTAVGQA